MKQLSNVEIGRLRALADLLDTVPAERFDLGGWGWVVHPAGSECGFAGCAVGWAARSRIFPGLRFNGMDIIYEEDEKDIWEGWVAVEVLFGLTFWSAGFLFDKSHYLDHYPEITPRVVARRLRRFADKVEGRLKLRKARRKLARAA